MVQVHEGRDSVSEYDSWTDLEENFALAYEPIPLSIKMATWRKMTKREILRKVNSKKIRKDFEYMSHGEILDQIEKMQKNAIYLKTKFGIGHLMPQQAHVAMVHRATWFAPWALDGSLAQLADNRSNSCNTCRQLCLFLATVL